MRHWSVTVERDGYQIVTIGHNHLSGRELSAEDEDTIRDAARHLLSFVGPKCRRCGDSGFVAYWDGSAYVGEGCPKCDPGNPTAEEPTLDAKTKRAEDGAPPTTETKE